MLDTRAGAVLASWTLTGAAMAERPFDDLFPRTRLGYRYETGPDSCASCGGSSSAGDGVSAEAGRGLRRSMSRRTPCVALLRGINVGGKNLIRMTDLKACFESMAFTEVSTYIQSGNVLFAAEGGDAGKLTRQLEETLSTTFGYEAKVVVRSRKQLAAVVAGAPPGWGEDGAHRYNVVFLKEPLTAREALSVVEVREDVEAVTAGPGVLYWSVLAQAAQRSGYARLPGRKTYQQMTIRTHGTVVRILDRLQGMGASSKGGSVGPGSRARRRGR